MLVHPKFTPALNLPESIQGLTLMVANLPQTSKTFDLATRFGAFRYLGTCRRKSLIKGKSSLREKNYMLNQKPDQ